MSKNVDFIADALREAYQRGFRDGLRKAVRKGGGVRPCDCCAAAWGSGHVGSCPRFKKSRSRQ